MTIKDFNSKVQSLNLRHEGAKAIVQTDVGYLNLQRTQLIFTGKGSDGKPLKRYRSAKYAGFKHQMNPYPGLGTPDLNLTGSFQSKLKIEVQGQNVVDVFSTDDKYKDLLAKYPNMLGLNKDSMPKYRSSYLNPALVVNVKSHLGLK